jgi:hypothetical protein
MVVYGIHAEPVYAKTSEKPVHCHVPLRYRILLPVLPNNTCSEQQVLTVNVKFLATAFPYVFTFGLGRMIFRGPGFLAVF